MPESILTISIAGLVAGFIFAMPIAGPISVLIVSNALNGKRKYSNQISIGASLSDFIYVFIAIFGITSFYSYYMPVIPYLLIAGSIFFIILGVNLYRQPVNLEYFEERSHVADVVKKSNRSGFYTGFMVNMFNATQFFSVLISSFFVISFVASLGLSTGGLEKKISNNIEEIGTMNGENIREKIPERFRQADIAPLKPHIVTDNNDEKSEASNLLVLSIFFATSISAGGLIWFLILAAILSRYRDKINVKVLNVLMRMFAISLCIMGMYFGFLGARQVI